MTNTDMIGKKFSRLLVVSADKNRHGRTCWICLCDCGKTVSAVGKALRSGKKRSCGCLRSELGVARAAIMSQNNRLPDGESGFNLLYANYRCQAVYKGALDFELTKDQLRKITSSDCFYCGVKPAQKIGNDLTGYYTYNGIDRSDNSKGYTIENCVPACGVHNKMKLTMSVDEFVAACRAVVNHFQ